MKKTVKMSHSDHPEPMEVEQDLMEGQSISAAVPTAGEETRTCSLPVSHFWYVSHIYQEEIKRIEKETGVKINADVKVTFEASQKDGSPATAFSEFTNLVQKSLGESEGSVIPLEYTDPEEWRDTLKIIQKKENKLLLTLNSEKMIICGPRQSQDHIKKTLNTSQKTLRNKKCATSPMSFTQDYSGSALNGAAKEEGVTAGDNEDENCCICLDTFKNKKQLKCKHEFCEDCLSKSVETMGPICPLCKYVFGRIQGFQPDGKMTWKTKRTSLPGFPGCGTIVINYDMQGGRQAARHPNPSKRYSGINRDAYLPNNEEGKEVLQLLKRAFDEYLIFTIGPDNQVIWHNIHHKTSKTGGPQCFGYPDPDYLSRVREELKVNGIE